MNIDYSHISVFEVYVENSYLAIDMDFSSNSKKFHFYCLDF